MSDVISGYYHLKPRCGVLVLMATCAVERDQVAWLQLLAASKDRILKLVCGKHVAVELVQVLSVGKVWRATMRN